MPHDAKRCSPMPGKISFQFHSSVIGCCRAEQAADCSIPSADRMLRYSAVQSLFALLAAAVDADGSPGWPETFSTETRRSCRSRYAERTAWIHFRTKTVDLKVIRCRTGSQWRRLYWISVTWSWRRVSDSRRAAVSLGLFTRRDEKSQNKSAEMFLMTREIGCEILKSKAKGQSHVVT